MTGRVDKIGWIWLHFGGVQFTRTGGAAQAVHRPCRHPRTGARFSEPCVGRPLLCTRFSRHLVHQFYARTETKVAAKSLFYNINTNTIKWYSHTSYNQLLTYTYTQLLSNYMATKRTPPPSLCVNGMRSSDCQSYHKLLSKSWKRGGLPELKVLI